MATISAVVATVATVATAAIAAIAAATSTASKHLESEIFIFVNFPNCFLNLFQCFAAMIFHGERNFLPNLYDFLPPYAATENRTHVSRVEPHRRTSIQDALPAEQLQSE